jgi:hypothetical protein
MQLYLLLLLFLLLLPPPPPQVVGPRPIQGTSSALTPTLVLFEGNISPKILFF